MTPDERNLITGLFDRLRSYGAVDKDREAEGLINTSVRQIPDSAYLMVQSVLVQEQALAAGNERIQELEARVRQLEASAQAPAAASGGSFLGGLFGSSKPAATSVPQTRGMAPVGSPWGQPAGQGAPQYQQPQYQQPPMQAAPARAGGGFMAQAMTTAAGVAGGMLAANAISNMMGGGHHNHGNQTASNTPVDHTAEDNQIDAQADQQYAADYSNNDPGVAPAADDGGGWGGGDTDA